MMQQIQENVDKYIVHWIDTRCELWCRIWRVEARVYRRSNSDEGSYTTRAWYEVSFKKSGCLDDLSFFSVDQIDDVRRTIELAHDWIVENPIPDNVCISVPFIS